MSIYFVNFQDSFLIADRFLMILLGFMQERSFLSQCQELYLVLSPWFFCLFLLELPEKQQITAVAHILVQLLT